jgi:hypothetical protein
MLQLQGHNYPSCMKMWGSWNMLEMMEPFTPSIHWDPVKVIVTRMMIGTYSPWSLYRYFRSIPTSLLLVHFSAEGLYCHQSNTGQNVPGCSENEGIGEEVTADYCAWNTSFPRPAPRPEMPADAFRLKLYWEEGYRWQNETIERKWRQRQH